MLLLFGSIWALVPVRNSKGNLNHSELIVGDSDCFHPARMSAMRGNLSAMLVFVFLLLLNVLSFRMDSPRRSGGFASP